MRDAHTETTITANMLKLNPRTCRGSIPPIFVVVANNSRKMRQAYTGNLYSSLALINFTHTQKCQVDLMSGKQVMTSYVRSCSAEIDIFFDL